MTSKAVVAELDEALDRMLQSDEPLGERLIAYADVLRQINRPFAEAVDRLVARLDAIGAGTSAPNIGEAMPSFLLPDETGRLFTLEDFLGRGPVIVAFRRGHWCPYCLLATEDLEQVQSVISARGGSVIVITPDREQFAKELKKRSRASFPILSDIDNGYALSIGIAIAVGEEMRDFMSRRGRDLATYQGNSSWMLPIPATFLLDANGILVMRHVDGDYRKRPASGDLIAAIEALPLSARSQTSPQP